MPSSTVTVTIARHLPSGMMVTMPKGGRGWLPNREVSYQRDFDPRDTWAIRKAHPVGVPVRVVVIGERGTEEGLPVVSIAAAIHDPWEHEVQEWVGRRAAKIMVVTDIDAPKYYRGQIQPGVEARVWKDDLELALGERTEDPFFIPRVGDRLVGTVVEADLDDRVVMLSTAELFRETAYEGAGEDEQPPSLRIEPDEALTILADTSASLLRELVDKRGPTIQEGPFPSATPPFSRILVLDDKQDVANCLGSWLEVHGCQVGMCVSIAQARSHVGIIIDRESGRARLDESSPSAAQDPVGAAVIDVNLEDDPDDGQHGGITFARELQDVYSACRIVLITGETIDAHSIRAKAEAAKGIEISSFLFKPVDGPELLDCLSRARTEPRRDAYDVLMEHLPIAKPVENLSTDATKARIRTVTQRYEDKTQQVVDGLGEDLKADSVFLFSMHPVTYETKVAAERGQRLENWYRFRRKLRYSPVGDVCLDPHPRSHEWYDP